MRGEALAVYSRAGGPPSTGRPLSRGHSDHPVPVAGTTLLADPDGALFWPEEKLLVVAGFGPLPDGWLALIEARNASKSVTSPMGRGSDGSSRYCT